MFTDEFGVLPELEFVETPVGMIYIATRRVGDNIWARMVENVLPNLQQVAPIWETGQQEHPFSGPMMSRWIVPLDDTNTMLIEFRHVSETEGVVTPDWWADRSIMLPGQLGADSYEESQRRPGDFEAQVSQRPVAVHGLEHLGTTDRGVTMFRKQIRRGIRAVKAGRILSACSGITAGYPDLLQRHSRARATGKDAGTGQDADARDRATAGGELHRGAATVSGRRIVRHTGDAKSWDGRRAAWVFSRLASVRLKRRPSADIPRSCKTAEPAGEQTVDARRADSRRLSAALERRPGNRRWS